MAQRLSSRPRRVLFNKRVQLCWARGAGISGGREGKARQRGHQAGEDGLARGGLGQRRWSAHVNEKGEMEPVWAGCPIGWATRDQSCIFLLLVLTSLRETLHPMFVVSTLSSGPNPFGSTNLRSALSKSNAELERWPWRSSASLGVPAAPAHAEPPAPSAEVRPVPHVVAKTNSSSTDLKQALVFFLNLVTTNWFTGGIRQRF